MDVTTPPRGAITELSENQWPTEAADGLPDFCRGRWETRRPWVIGTESGQPYTRVGWCKADQPSAIGGATPFTCTEHVYGQNTTPPTSARVNVNRRRGPPLCCVRACVASPARLREMSFPFFFAFPSERKIAREAPSFAPTIFLFVVNVHHRRVGSEVRTRRLRACLEPTGKVLSARRARPAL